MAFLCAMALPEAVGRMQNVVFLEDNSVKNTTRLAARVTGGSPRFPWLRTQTGAQP